jgi:Tfp pilus assembly protein PilZ
MGAERRRDSRHAVRVGLAFSLAGQEIVTETDDVSFSGIFVHTDHLPPVRQLLRLTLTLPPEGDTLVVTAMVARIVPAKAGVKPGVGLRFFGLDPGDRARWERFVRQAAADEVAAQFPSVFPAATPNVVNRRFTRHVVPLRVLLHSREALQELYTRDVSKGGIFVRTPLDLGVGTMVKVQVPHPTTGEVFELRGTVRRQQGPPEPGLGIEFSDLNDNSRDEFFDFIRALLPVPEVEYLASAERRTDAAPPARRSPVARAEAEWEWPETGV